MSEGEAVEVVELDELQWNARVAFPFSERPILVDYYASWCGPCGIMMGILPDVAAKLADSVDVAKMDVDKHRNVARAVNVRGLPTLVLYQYGQPIKRWTGVQSADNLVRESLAALNEQQGEQSQWGGDGNG